jgi:hypothetical protein
LTGRGCTLGMPVSGREPAAARGACARWYRAGAATGRPGSLPRCAAAREAAAGGGAARHRRR